MKKYISASMNNKQKRYYVSYCRIFKDGGKGSPDACYMYATNEFELLDKIHTRFQDTNMYRFAITYRED